MEHKAETLQEEGAMRVSISTQIVIICLSYKAKIQHGRVTLDTCCNEFSFLCCFMHHWKSCLLFPHVFLMCGANTVDYYLFKYYSFTTGKMFRWSTDPLPRPKCWRLLWVLTQIPNNPTLSSNLYIFRACRFLFHHKLFIL